MFKPGQPSLDCQQIPKRPLASCTRELAEGRGPLLAPC